MLLRGFALSKIIYMNNQTLYTNFIGNLLYFGFPANDSMFSLIILFSEIFFIGLAIIYLISEIFIRLIYKFVNTKKKVPAHFTAEMESFLDIFFLSFPTAIILYILTPTLGYLYISEFGPESNFSLTINITGHQWYWTYEYHYLGFNKVLEIDFTKVMDLVFFDSIMLNESKLRLLLADYTAIIPVHTHILLQITSDDVIHSWAVPQLGIKVDAIPGRISTAVLFLDVKGKWFGQCSELCGALHGFMPIAVQSVSIPTFIIWLLTKFNLEYFIEF